MIVRAAASVAPSIPSQQPFGFVDGQIINARMTRCHKTMFVESPIFITVAAPPLAASVVPFISEADRDAVGIVRPQLLDETIFVLARPFMREKRLDLEAAANELIAVSPLAVGRVGERDLGRITPVPSVLSCTDFLRGGFAGKRRYGRALFHLRSGERRCKFDADATGHRADKMPRRRPFADWLGRELDCRTRMRPDPRMYNPKRSIVSYSQGEMVEADVRFAIERRRTGWLGRLPQSQQRAAVADELGGIVRISANFAKTKSSTEKVGGRIKVRHGEPNDALRW
jgi:hypothetical protein